MITTLISMNMIKVIMSHVMVILYHISIVVITQVEQKWDKVSPYLLTANFNIYYI